MPIARLHQPPETLLLQCELGLFDDVAALYKTNHGLWRRSMGLTDGHTEFAFRFGSLRTQRLGLLGVLHETPVSLGQATSQLRVALVNLNEYSVWKAISLLLVERAMSFMFVQFSGSTTTCA